MDAGALPALARLRDEVGLHTITSVFPSVTGPAYVPFLCGRYPGPAGIPGIRWLHRDAPAARRAGRARSYVGIGMRDIDAHLDPGAPTLFELAPPALAAMAMFGRGLSPRDRLGAGAWFALRAARAHFRGDTAPEALGVEHGERTHSALARHHCLPARFPGETVASRSGSSRQTP